MAAQHRQVLLGGGERVRLVEAVLAQVVERGLEAVGVQRAHGLDRFGDVVARDETRGEEG